MTKGLAIAVMASAAALLGPPNRAFGQQPAAASTAIDTGQMAPDFTVAGATRYGLLKDPVRLSDFRGQTVVLAFLFKARTRG